MKRFGNLALSKLFVVTKVSRKPESNRVIVSIIAAYVLWERGLEH